MATKETGSVLYQTVKGTNFDLVPSKLLNRVPRTAHTTNLINKNNSVKPYKIYQP